MPEQWKVSVKEAQNQLVKNPNQDGKTKIRRQKPYTRRTLYIHGKEKTTELVSSVQLGEGTLQVTSRKRIPCFTSEERKPYNFKAPMMSGSVFWFAADVAPWQMWQPRNPFSVRYLVTAATKTWNYSACADLHVFKEENKSSRDHLA